MDEEGEWVGVVSGGLAGSAVAAVAGVVVGGRLMVGEVRSAIFPAALVEALAYRSNYCIVTFLFIVISPRCSSKTQVV